MKRRIVAFISAVIMVAGMALTALPAVSAGSADPVVYKEWKLADELRNIAKASSDAGEYTEPGEFSLIMRHKWYSPGVQNYVYGGGTASDKLYGYYGSNQAWRNYIDIPVNQGVGAGTNVCGAVSHGDYTGTDHEFTVTTPVSGKYSFVPLSIGGAGNIENSAMTANGSGWTVTLSVGGTVIESKTINGTGELPSFTDMDIDYNTPITLLITPVADDFTSNQANIMYLNFAVQMTDEYLKQIPNPAVDVVEYNVAQELAVTSGSFTVPTLQHGFAVVDDVGKNSVEGKGVSIYTGQSPALLSGGITFYKNTYDPSSDYYLNVNPTDGTLQFKTKHHTANHAIKFTASFDGQWTFGMQSVSGGSMYFVDKDGTETALSGKFEKTVTLYEGETVYLMQNDTDTTGSWSVRYCTVTGFTVTGRKNVIRHDTEYKTEESVDAYTELKKVTAASNWSDATYQANYEVKHSGALHLYRNVGEGVTPEITLGSRTNSTAWYFGNNTANTKTPSGKMDVSRDGKATDNGYEISFGGYATYNVGFYYEVPADGLYVVSSDSVTVNGSAKTFLGYVGAETMTGTSKNILSSSFSREIELKAGQKLVFTVLLGANGNTVNINGLKIERKSIVKEAYDEVLPILVDDENAPQLYKYKIDRNNYAETILGKADVSYKNGVLTYAIPARDDKGVIEREYPYDRMDFATDYHWSLWLWKDTKWVRMDKDTDSDTFTESYTSANGLYKIHITCTDDEGAPLLNKVDTVFDYTSEQLGNAVITDVLVNGKEVDKTAFVDIAAADETVKVTVKGVNISGVTAKKEGALLCVFTKVGDDYEYTFKNVDIGKLDLGITAKAAENKNSDERKITVYTYNTREIGNYTEIDGATATVSGSGTVSITAGETVNPGTYNYDITTLYTDKNVYSVTGIASNSVNASIGKQYGNYAATVTAKGKVSSDYATILFDYTRPGGKWSMNVNLNGENADTITVAPGTPVQIDMSAVFSGSLGTENLQYSIMRNDSEGKHTIIKWGDRNTYTYNPVNTGYYVLYLMAKGSGTDAPEIIKKITITVEGEMYDGNLTVEYGNPTVGNPITLKAVADEEGLLYRFKLSTAYTTTTLQRYSPSNSCVWIPTKEGTYTLIVEALSQDSFGVFDVHETFSIEVSAIPEGEGTVEDSKFSATSTDISEDTEFNPLLMGGGGYVTGLVMHPKDTSIMYARTDVGGAYRWDGAYDEGRGRWIAMTESFGENETTQYAVDGIAIDPNNLDVVYMCCGNGNGTGTRGIYKSTNRGATWTLIKGASFFGNSRDRELGECIMVDPNDSNTIYCGTRGEGLLISRDGGTTWTKVSTSIIPSNYDYPSAPYGIRGVEIDPRTVTANGRSKNVYVSLPNVGIYKSSDGGETWAKISGIPETIQNMKLDTVGNIYITATDGVYLYNGSTVKDISPTQNNTIQPAEKAKTFKAIAVSDTPGTLAVCRAIGGYWGSNHEVVDSQMQENIYYSTDYGETWTLKSGDGASSGITKAETVPWWPAYYFSSNTACMMFHKDPAKNTTELWFSDWYGVWMAKDVTASKVTWYNRTRGIEEAVVTDMMSNKAGPIEFNMTMVDNGGMAIANVGDYAERRYDYNGRALDFCESKPQYVVIAGIDNSWNSGNCGISSDYGVTFTGNKGTGAPVTIIDIAIDCRNENNIVLIPKDDVPYYTTDQGATWHRSSGVPDSDKSIFGSVNTLVSDRVKTGVFYLSAGEGFYRSIDGGKTWSKTCTLPCTGQVITSPGKGGYVIVSCRNKGLFYSKNFGKDFTKVQGITNAASASFGIGENGNGFVVYVRGTVDGRAGLFRSDDGLNTFVQYNDIDTNKLGLFSSIEADRRVYGRVFLGSGGRGIMIASLKDGE